MQVVTLDHGKAAGGASCQVSLYGATLISWKVSGQEVIYVSKKAVLDGTKAIRGGIPICFPQFGPWEHGPQHGFARTSKDWTVSSPVQVDETSGDAKVTLVLKDTEATRKSWDHRFTLKYSLVLKATELQLEATVINENEGPPSSSFPMTFCFHTYINLPDVRRCHLEGFQGLTYKDKTKEGQPEKVEDREVVTVADFTDRIYYDAPNQVTLHGLQDGKTLVLAKSNMDDFTVWNPWDKNKLADLGEDEYQNMLCVEATQASKAVLVEPGRPWTAVHNLKLADGPPGKL